MLAGPDERQVLEQIAAAEVAAASHLRRVLGLSDLSQVVERFRALQDATGERGDAWAATVDRVLLAALNCVNAADPGTVALVRIRAQDPNQGPAACLSAPP